MKRTINMKVYSDLFQVVRLPSNKTVYLYVREKKTRSEKKNLLVLKKLSDVKGKKKKPTT